MPQNILTFTYHVGAASSNELIELAPKQELSTLSESYPNYFLGGGAHQDLKNFLRKNP